MLKTHFKWLNLLNKKSSQTSQLLAIVQDWEFALFSLFCFCHSYKKSNGSNSLLSLFTKRATGANCSSRSLSKEQKQQFATVSKERWETKSDSLFLRVGVEEKTSNLFFSACFSSFYAQNKRANHSRCSFKKWDESDFPFFLVTHLLSKNKQFTWKTKEQIPDHAIVSFKICLNNWLV